MPSGIALSPSEAEAKANPVPKKKQKDVEIEFDSSNLNCVAAILQFGVMPIRIKVRDCRRVVFTFDSSNAVVNDIKQRWFAGLSIPVKEDDARSIFDAQIRGKEMMASVMSQARRGNPDEQREYDVDLRKDNIVQDEKGQSDPSTQ